MPHKEPPTKDLEKELQEVVGYIVHLIIFIVIACYMCIMWLVLSYAFEILHIVE